MSDENQAQPAQPSPAPKKKFNSQCILIGGPSGVGKSRSLKNIPNQDRWIYANCDAGKQLPFRNDFKNSNITKYKMVPSLFKWASMPENAPNIDGFIIDTFTFLMDLFESQGVLTLKDKMGGWSDYNQFAKEIMQEHVPNFGKPTLILAHTSAEPDESGIMQNSTTVKGALKKQGLEAYFGIVVETRVMRVAALEDYANPMLVITDRDRKLGVKHVFQTQKTADTLGLKIRAPEDMFTDEQTFIDNDAWALLQHVTNYYQGT